MGQNHHLASLQLAIMQVLWDKEEATVGEVQEALRKDRPLAYTTVATMLVKMERNRQVEHRTERRVNVYRPVLAEDKVRRSMVSDLASRLFQGDVTELVSHLLDDRDVTAKELRRLRELIRRKEKETGHGR